MQETMHVCMYVRSHCIPCMPVIQCHGTDLPNFANAQTITPFSGLFAYAHEVIYACSFGGYRFEDGDTAATVTCSATGWTWNSIVTSCKRTLILCLSHRATIFETRFRCFGEVETVVYLYHARNRKLSHRQADN